MPSEMSLAVWVTAGPKRAISSSIDCAEEIAVERQVHDAVVQPVRRDYAHGIEARVHRDLVQDVEAAGVQSLPDPLRDPARHLVHREQVLVGDLEQVCGVVARDHHHVQAPVRVLIEQNSALRCRRSRRTKRSSSEFLPQCMSL